MPAEFRLLLVLVQSVGLLVGFQPAAGKLPPFRETLTGWTESTGGVAAACNKVQFIIINARCRLLLLMRWLIRLLPLLLGWFAGVTGQFQR